MFKLLFLPFKLLRGLFKLTGVKGAIWLGIGVALGVLLAPEAGADLRAKLKAKLSDRAGGDTYPEDVDLTL